MNPRLALTFVVFGRAMTPPVDSRQKKNPPRIPAEGAV